MNRTELLAKAPVGKLMWKFYVPAFIGVIANALYNIIDRIFIGQGVGAAALSGVSATFPMMLIIIAFGMLIGVGSGVLVSIKLGEQKRHEAEKVLGNNLFMVAAISLLLTPVFLFTQKYFLELFGATDQTIGYAMDYFSIIIFGVVFQMSGFSMNNIIRSEGNARIAMISMLLSAGVNVVLDWLFIIKFGWGVKGAAWATIIAMFVLSVWVVAHFVSKRSVVKLTLRNIRPNGAIIKEAVAIGMAPFAMQLSQSVVQAMFNKKLVLYGGDYGVGAMGILISVLSFFLMTVFALNMAAQPIIGFAYGAKNFSRVKHSLKLAVLWATAISIVATILLQIYPDYVVKLFNDDSLELQRLSVNGLRIITLSLPIVGFQIINGNYFQSVGKAKLSLFLTLLRQVVFLTPLVLILPGIYGTNGIWYSMPISDALSAVVSFILLVREWRRLSVETAPLHQQNT